MSKTMAAVLAEHTEVRIFGPRCRCGKPLAIDDAAGSLATHQAAVLSAAGFGLVADAKAEAWEQGYGQGYSDHVWSKGHEPRDRNPYPVSRSVRDPDYRTGTVAKEPQCVKQPSATPAPSSLSNK